jgi:hypothetical protein
MKGPCATSRVEPVAGVDAIKKPSRPPSGQTRIATRAWRSASQYRIGFAEVRQRRVTLTDGLPELRSFLDGVGDSDTQAHGQVKRVVFTATLSFDTLTHAR